MQGSEPAPVAPGPVTPEQTETASGTKGPQSPNSGFSGRTRTAGTVAHAPFAEPMERLRRHAACNPQTSGFPAGPEPQDSSRTPPSCKTAKRVRNHAARAGTRKSCTALCAPSGGNVHQRPPVAFAHFDLPEPQLRGPRCDRRRVLRQKAAHHQIASRSERLRTGGHV